MSFITGIHIGAQPRRCSHLPLLGGLLALGFFVARIYSNSFMSSFLDSTQVIACSNELFCQLSMDCYATYHLREKLSLGYCMCNMNEEQMSIAGKPLHKRHSSGLRGRSIDDHDYDLLATYQDPFRGVQMLPKGQLLLVLARISSTVDRLFETGIASQKLLELTRSEINEYRAKSFHKLYTYFDLPSGDQFLEFNSTSDWFDLDRFFKIRPIFEFCFVFISGVFLLECSSVVKRPISRVWTWVVGICDLCHVQISSPRIPAAIKFHRQAWNSFRRSVRTTISVGPRSRSCE